MLSPAPAAQPALFGMQVADQTEASGFQAAAGSGDLTELIAWMEATEVTQGPLRGQPFAVLPWQRRLLRGVLKPRVMTAACSTPRGQGKTTFVSLWSLAYVIPGAPLFEPRSETLIVSASMRQAGVNFDAVKAVARPWIEQDTTAWRLNSSANHRELLHAPSDSRVICVALNPATSEGRIPRFIVCDEVRNWPRSKTEAMRSVLESSLTKMADAKMLAIGVRPGGRSWFADWLDAKGADYRQLHAAERGDDPFAERTMSKANPSWRFFPQLRRSVRAAAVKAKDDEHALQTYRALHLNVGEVDVLNEVLCSAADWEEALARGPAERTGPMIWGIDTSENRAMTAITAYWPRTGAMDAIGFFPELPSLEERGRRAGVGSDYAIMARRGELKVTGRRTVDLVAAILIARARWQGWPAAIAADRWKEAALRQALEEAGCSPQLTELAIRGMGYQDGGEDVRAAQKAILDGDVIPDDNLLLSSAVSELRLLGPDPGGNWKIAQNAEAGRRSTAQDDAAVAAVLALGVAARGPEPLLSQQARRQLRRSA